MADLSERAAAVHSGNIDPSVDNMLKITSDGRKIGLDQRLMNPLLPDDPGSKLNACVQNVLRIWEEGQADKLTQLLFCDLSTPKGDGAFNVYEDIRDKLVAAGVPREEIAFIHDADTEAKKKELFGKVRTGEVRVLLGSTQKMGAGNQRAGPPCGGPPPGRGLAPRRHDLAQRAHHPAGQPEQTGADFPVCDGGDF